MGDFTSPAPVSCQNSISMPPALRMTPVMCWPIRLSRVHRLGTDILPSAGGSGLRVQLHHAGLHRHPSSPRARPAPVPAPRAPILEVHRRCSAPAPRVEPAPSLPRAGVPVRLAAGSADRLMNLTDKANWASTRRAGSACRYRPETAITDLTGTDTKIAFLARHQTTIGSRTL
jgi:hypothetical protein